jgi:hypothetical protein
VLCGQIVHDVRSNRYLPLSLPFTRAAVQSRPAG